LINMISLIRKDQEILEEYSFKQPTIFHTSYLHYWIIYKFGGNSKKEPFIT
jgi:hypothetical protein